MSEASNSVVLRINDRDFAGWSSVAITRGIEQIAASFELSVSDGGPLGRSISAGDRCQVLIGGEQIVDGFVDERNVEYAKNTHSISIVGRDATGDLVDCSAAIKQTKGINLLAIARAACAPFGIKVTATADVGKPFIREYAEPGQTVFDLLSTLAAHRGVLLLSDGHGGLTIGKEGTSRSPGALVYGKNIESCSANDSLRDRFSDYTALHQAAQDDNSNGTVATETKGKASDAGVRRHRPLTVLADDGGDLKNTASYERNVRAGRARSITYTVSGWHADGSRLWQPNTRVPVTDAHQSPALNNTPMLITACAFRRDSEGTRCELTVMRPGAFDALATPEAA